MRQYQCLTAPPTKLTDIFITHMHGDHIFGLPSLLLHLNEAMVQAKKSDAKHPTIQESIKIYGPEGLYNYICANIKLSRAMLTIHIVVHEFVVKETDEMGNNNKRHLTLRQKSLKDAEMPIPELRYDKISRVAIENDSLDVGNSLSWSLPDVLIFSGVNHRKGVMKVKAVAIKHTIPCYGYVFEVRCCYCCCCCCCCCCCWCIPHPSLISKIHICYRERRGIFFFSPMSLLSILVNF
jgi:ribonuclease BN (tRNA processing enzyme)